MDSNSVHAQRAMVTGEEFYEAKERGARSHERTGNHRTKPREAIISIMEDQVDKLQLLATGGPSCCGNASRCGDEVCARTITCDQCDPGGHQGRSVGPQKAIR